MKKDARLINCNEAIMIYLQKIHRKKYNMVFNKN